MFPVTAPEPIYLKAIPEVTLPVTGDTPVTFITAEQYTGTVTWSPAHATFAANTPYTANITLTAKPGYTLDGVGQNFFTAAGAASVNNAANSGNVTAVFPATTPVYIITGTSPNFTAERGTGGTVTSGVIQTVIDAIRSDTAGNACTVRFGNGEVLNIGSTAITFNGAWGALTLGGKISGTASSYVIITTDTVGVTSTADIASASVSSSKRVISHGSTGMFTIAGGTISCGSGGPLVTNSSSGTVTISGGTLSSNNGGGVKAIYNSSTGNVIISGGTVNAGGNDLTIDNYSTGNVTITGGTVSVAGTGYAYWSPSGAVSVTSPPAVIIGLTNP